MKHASTKFCILNVIFTQWALVWPSHSLWWDSHSPGNLEVQWTNSQEPPQVWVTPVTSLLASLTLENFRPLTLMLHRSDGFLTQYCFSWNTMKRVSSQGRNKTIKLAKTTMTPCWRWRQCLVQWKEHGLWSHQGCHLSSYSVPPVRWG